MIPETGSVDEFKEAALRFASKNPVCHEVYWLDMERVDGREGPSIGVITACSKNKVYIRWVDCVEVWAMDISMWDMFLNDGQVKFLGFWQEFQKDHDSRDRYIRRVQRFSAARLSQVPTAGRGLPNPIEFH